jgi:hypothetical protein
MVNELIAIENGPIIGDLPIQIVIFPVRFLYVYQAGLDR